MWFLVLNGGERPVTKNFWLATFFSVVDKTFEKLVNRELVDHTEKYGLL